MRKFDLEAAKRGEPIQTRDGKHAKFIAHVPETNSDSNKVIALINGDLRHFCEDGAWISSTDPRGNDLFMAPKKRTVWVNLYSFGEGHAKHYETEEDASEAAQRTFAKRIGNRAWPVEIEE